jgi:hypothetical protein
VKLKRGTIMKTAFALIFSAALLAAASDPNPQATKSIRPDEPAGKVKKIGAVTWDLDSHKLLWTVQKGSVVEGAFVPDSEEHYEISPDQATMLFAEETRGFDNREAASLHRLLDTLSMYCAESVVWWDQGKGVPVETTSPERKPEPKKTEPNPVKVREPQSKRPAPRKYRVPDNHIVAMNR